MMSNLLLPIEWGEETEAIGGNSSPLAHRFPKTVPHEVIENVDSSLSSPSSPSFEALARNDAKREPGSGGRGVSRVRSTLLFFKGTQGTKGTGQESVDKTIACEFPLPAAQRGTKGTVSEIKDLGSKRTPPPPQPFDPLAQPLAAALAGMSTLKDPCPGFRLNEWPDVWYRALQFLNEREFEATALGWDAVSLLGVHPTVGLNRVDYTGALLCSDSPVALITADTVTYRNGNKFHRSTVPADAVPLWAFYGAADAA